MTANEEWNVTTLREHMLALRAADALAIAAALTAAERAVAKAEIAAEKRFEGLNELRKVVNDVVATLITRSESDTQLKALAEKTDISITSITRELNSALKRMDNSDGQGVAKNHSWVTMAAVIVSVCGATGIIAALMSIFHSVGH